MKLVNLTPHEITFVTESGNNLVVAPSGEIARVTTSTKEITRLSNGIPVTETLYGEVEGLPKPEPDTLYIVSSLVAQRCKERRDVFIPNESVRDDKGRIIGCRSLGRV